VKGCLNKIADNTGPLTKIQLLPLMRPICRQVLADLSLVASWRDVEGAESVFSDNRQFVGIDTSIRVKITNTTVDLFTTAYISDFASTLLQIINIPSPGIVTVSMNPNYYLEFSFEVLDGLDHTGQMIVDNLSDNTTLKIFNVNVTAF
jgi:hypothetical protein